MKRYPYSPTKASPNQKWFKKTYSTKNKTVVVSKAAFRPLLKRLGVSVPKGAKSYTFKGSSAIQKAFSRIAGNIQTNPHAPKSTATKRYIGLLGGSISKSVTIKIGKALPAAGSAGKFLQRGETIKKADLAQTRNFGIRADGTARKGYTLAQCAFSFEFRRAGSTAKSRYGDGGTSSSYRKSVINRVRGKFGLAGYLAPQARTATKYNTAGHTVSATYTKQFAK